MPPCTWPSSAPPRSSARCPPLQDLSLETPGWTTFLLLTGGAAVAQLFTVRTKRNYAYHTTGVFLFAGALLLPAALWR